MKTPKHYLKEILKEILPKYCEGDAVDVGAGHARYRVLIEPLCVSYTTVDNMSSDVQFGEYQFTPDIISDVLTIPVADGSYDTAICTEVLEHVENPFKLVAELSRILKKGGYVIMSSGWMAPYHQEPKDYWRFSIDGYKALCEQSGLEFVEAVKKGGLFTALFYSLYRNIELNTPKDKILRKIFDHVRKPTEIIAAWMDKLIKTEDTIGHVVIALKK